jgi:hypothetical protein
MELGKSPGQFCSGIDAGTQAQVSRDGSSVASRCALLCGALGLLRSSQGGRGPEQVSWGPASEPEGCMADT